MIIYCMCVNPEMGNYLAFFNEDPDKKVVAGSIEEAVGRLVMQNVGVKVDSVYEVDTHRE